MNTPTEQLDPAAVITQLETTARRIASPTNGLPDKDLLWKPSADSWCVNEVVAHLRACADVWGDSIAKILEQDNPTFRYVSPRTWIRETNYLNVDFRTSLLEFQNQRRNLLKILRPLGHEQWQRRALVKASKHRTETVLSYAQRLAIHEASHCEQIDRILHALQQSQS